MDQGYNQYQGATLGSGPVAKTQSLAEMSHFLMLQSEAVLKALNQIISRLDNVGLKENPDDGSRPSMTIQQQLQCTTQIVGKANELLGQLDRKIFG